MSRPGIVFEDAELRAVFQPAARPGVPWLLISFASLGDRPVGAQFWGRTMAGKAGIPALGIVATRPNWYPTASMAALAEAVRPILSSFGEAVTYGFSMGGYAALKYGTLLGAGTAVAISPQHSIDPADCAPAGTPYAAHFCPDLHPAMCVRAEDLSARCIVVFDPFDRTDADAAGRLQALAPRLLLLPAPMTGHGTVRLFAGTEVAGNLFDLSRRGEAVALRRLVTEQRRSHWVRLASVCRMAAAGGRPDRARRLLEARGATVPPSFLAKLHVAAATRLLRQRRAGDAAWFIGEVERLSPAHAGLAALRRDAALASGNPTEAMPWARQAATASSAIRQDRQTLAELLLRNGALEEAETALLALHRERGDDGRTLVTLSDLHLRRGDAEGARAWLERAVALAPSQASVRRRLAALAAEVDEAR